MEFDVTITRREYRSHVFRVEANTAEESEELAREKASDHDFGNSPVFHADEEVMSVRPFYRKED